MKEPVLNNFFTEVINGDCLDIMRAMPSNSVNLIVTSPPYFNAKDYSQWKSYADYLAFMEQVFIEAFRVLSPGRMMCINSSSVIVAREKRSARSQRFNIPADLHGLCKGFWFVEEIIWQKPEGAATGRNRRFTVDRNPLMWKANPDTERIGIYQKPIAKLNDAIIRSYQKHRVELNIRNGEVWKINPKSSKHHPAPFPNEIPSRLIQLYTWPNDLVLDPFGGEGTTAMEAERHGRRCIIIEKDAGYYKRIKNYLKQDEDVTKQSA